MATCSKSDLEPSEMECPVCMDLYALPKILPCGHLVCRCCLLSWLKSKVNVGCPRCQCAVRDKQDKKKGRSVQEMVDDFPTDLAMAALVEAQRVLAKKHFCCICNNVASAVCLDCGDMFCSSCKTLHTKQSVSKHHKLEDLTSLTTTTLAALRPVMCTDHQDKPKELFCPSHGASVCLLCATTTHRQCQQVVSLKTRIQKVVAELDHLTALLTEGEEQVDININLLDQHIEETRKHAEHTLIEIQTMGQRLESAVRDCCSRLNEMVHKAVDDVIKVDNKDKSVLLERRGKLITHKTVIERAKRQHEKCYVSETNTQLTKRVTHLYRSSTTPPGGRLVRSFNFTLDRDAETKIVQVLSHLGTATINPQSGGAFLEQTEFQFHHTHGIRIKLSNNNKTAERSSKTGNDAIVVSCNPMLPQMLYEVQVETVSKNYPWIDMGVLNSSPDTFNLPNSIWRPDKSVLCLSSRGDKFIFGQLVRPSPDERPTPMEKLTNITVGSRVGLALDKTRNLHLYLQGNDQGVVATNIPQPAYFVFDLVARCTKVTAQPLTRIN